MCSRACQCKSLVLTVLVLASLIAPCRFAAQAKNSLPADSLKKELVVLDVVVTDKKNQLVKNLKAEHFTVFDEKVKQSIQLFSDEEVPVSVGILLDVSGSMKFDQASPKQRPIEVFKAYLQPFLKHNHSLNEYFLMSFGAQPQLLSDWTRDKNVILESANKISRPKGATALVDTCLQALELANRGANRRRAIIVIGDAEENASQRGFKELEELVKQSNVRFYPITIAAIDNDSPHRRAIHSAMKKIAALSGGTYFVISGAVNLAYALDQILAEFKHQYTIGFYQPKYDNQWHTVQVRIAPVEIKDSAKPDKPAEKVAPSVRTRQGYYAK
jgi:Ca-activated chloride channel homolog